jgi:hypothetical protein
MRACSKAVHLNVLTGPACEGVPHRYDITDDLYNVLPLWLIQM